MKKQKNLNIFKLILPLFFIVATFFNFGYLPKAQAACSYKILEFGIKKKGSTNYISTANQTDTIVISTVIQKSGSSTDCNQFAASTVTDSIQINTKSGWINFYSGDPRQDSTLSYVDGIAHYDSQDENLNFIDRANFAVPNKLELRMVIKQGGTVLLQQSAPYSIDISGALGSNGSVTMYLAFDPAKGTYQKDDVVKTIGIIPDKSQINNLDANIKNIYFETLVNGKKVGSFTQPRGVFASQDPYQDNIAVTKENGFFDGQNIVSASLWQAGTSIKIADANATMQVTGTGVAAPVTGGGGAAGLKENNVDCGDSSECKSNFCDYDTSKCEACAVGTAGDAACNTVTAGFKCSAAGVCVAPASGGNGTGGTGSGIQNNSATNLFNPLPEDDLTHAFILVLNGLLGILGILAVVFIVVGGVQMVVSAGNEEAIAKAKKTITYAVIGLLAALLSFSMIAIVQDLLQANLNPSTTQNIKK